MATQQDSEIPQASKPKILPDSVLDSEEPALRKKQAVMEWLLGKIKVLFFQKNLYYQVSKLSDQKFCEIKMYREVITDISLTPFLSTYFLPIMK